MIVTQADKNFSVLYSALIARPDLVCPFLEILNALEHAENTHPTWGPDASKALGYMAEEVGEVFKEVNDFNSTSDNAHLVAAGKEAAQVGATAIRFLLHLPKFVPSGE